MAVRQVANGWQVDASYKGVRAPRVTVPTKHEAQKLEALFRNDLEAGRTPVVPKPEERTLAQERYDCTTLRGLLDYTVRKRWGKAKAGPSLTRSARLMVEELGYDTRVDEVTSQMISEACFRLEAGGNKTSTINRKLAGLKVMLKYAVKLGVIDTAPEIEMGTEYVGRIRYFSDEEEESLLTYFNDDLLMRDTLIIGLDLGYRQGEIWGLQGRDYVPTTNRLHLWETKGDRPRANHCTERVKEIVVRRTNSLRSPVDYLFEPLNRREISRRMHSWKKYHGLPETDEACFHVTRHTCCTRLVMAGVPLPVVKDWMGHSDIATTMKYIHFAPNHLDVAFQAIQNGGWKMSPVTEPRAGGDIHLVA